MSWAIAYFPFQFSRCASPLTILSALTGSDFFIPTWLPPTWWVHGVSIIPSYVQTFQTCCLGGIYNRKIPSKWLITNGLILCPHALCMLDFSTSTQQQQDLH